MKRILVISTLIIGFLGCSREIECTDPPIYFSFISIPQNALDTLVLRKFKKDANFQELVDTLQITSANGGIINYGDTSRVSLDDPYNYPIPGFDWQIFIPAINRTVSITDINMRTKTGKCAAMSTDCFCNNEILGLKVDNQAGVLQTTHSVNLFIR